jgi:DNA-binding response OmpR family regulator
MLWGNNVLRVEDLDMDLIARTITRNERQIELTSREFSLLEILMLSSPRPISKALLLERVWGRRLERTNVVSVHVNRLRKKVNLPGAPPLLHTIRGLGFVVARKPG